MEHWQGNLFKTVSDDLGGIDIPEQGIGVLYDLILKMQTYDPWLYDVPPILNPSFHVSNANTCDLCSYIHVELPSCFGDRWPSNGANPSWD